MFLKNVSENYNDLAISMILKITLDRNSNLDSYCFMFIKSCIVNVFRLEEYCHFLC